MKLPNLIRCRVARLHELKIKFEYQNLHIQEANAMLSVVRVHISVACAIAAFLIQLLLLCICFACKRATRAPESLCKVHTNTHRNAVAAAAAVQNEFVCAIQCCRWSINVSQHKILPSQLTNQQYQLQQQQNQSRIALFNNSIES